jgi:hypothetical protein
MSERAPDINVGAEAPKSESERSGRSREIGHSVEDGLMAGLAVIKCKSCPVRVEKPDDWLCPFDVIEMAESNTPEPGTDEALLLRIANNTQVRCTENVEAGIDPIILASVDQLEDFTAERQARQQAVSRSNTAQRIANLIIPR